MMSGCALLDANGIAWIGPDDRADDIELEFNGASEAVGSQFRHGRGRGGKG